jgi:hypothetical protein
MIEVHDTALVVSFPEVDDEAILHFHFSRGVSPDQFVPVEKVGGDVRVGTEGTILMHLRPDFARRDQLYREARYPFALLVSVSGRNAITGEPSTALVRCPQNYFTTPPQGGIDGYFFGGKVHPFRVSGDDLADRPCLEVRVFPMKNKAFAYFKHQLQLIPGWGPSALRGITLLHGGERSCEPIYEDICSIGDWEMDHEERILVSLKPES